MTLTRELASCVCSLKHSHTRSYRFLLLLVGFFCEDGTDSLSVDRYFACHSVA